MSPIYSFMCKTCKKEFEVITQTVKEGEKDINQRCSNCGSPNVKKLLGSFLWRFGSMAGDRNERKDK